MKKVNLGKWFFFFDRDVKLCNNIPKDITFGNLL